MKNEKNKNTPSASRRLRDARTRPAGSPTPSDRKKLSVAQMEEANERSLRTRGRLAYSPIAIARAKMRDGEVSAEGEASRPVISIARLRPLSEDWLRIMKMNGFSPRTTTDREHCLERLFWFIKREGFKEVGRREIEAYLLHIRTGHTEECGRFGTGAHNPKAYSPASDATYRHHFNIVAAFFSWQTKEGLWQQSPFKDIPRGKSSDVREVFKPFTNDEIAALLRTAKRGPSPARDTAILLFLLDTGVRASEMCGIKMGDFNKKTQGVEVLGKGNKRRMVYFGTETAKSLWKHMADMTQVFGVQSDESPLFVAERGTRAGQHLKADSLQSVVERLGKAADVPHVHPHRFRYTFAIRFLKNGGNQLSLMRLLGHTDLTMTQHYVQFVDADIEEQHRRFSPADRLRG